MVWESYMASFLKDFWRNGFHNVNKWIFPNTQSNFSPSEYVLTFK